MESLEDHDDVANVCGDFDIPSAEMEAAVALIPAMNGQRALRTFSIVVASRTRGWE